MSNTYGLTRKGLEAVALSELQRIITDEFEFTFVSEPCIQALADVILFSVGDSQEDMNEERIIDYTREELEAIVGVGLKLPLSDDLSDEELRKLILQKEEVTEEGTAVSTSPTEVDIDETSIIKLKKLTGCQIRFRDEKNFYKTERYAKLFADTGSPYTKQAQKASFLVLHSKVWASADVAYVGCAGQVQRATFDRVLRTALEEGTLVQHDGVLYPFVLIVDRISAPGL